MGTAFYGRRFSFSGADLWRPCTAASTTLERTCGEDGVVEYVGYARLQKMLEQHPHLWNQKFDDDALAP